MPQSQSDLNSKLNVFLKKRAPYSIIDRGLEYANSGSVSECSKSANTISGIVLDNDGHNYSVSLGIISAHEIEAECDCCSKDEIEEQWCPHAVALLWRAAELDFFDPQGGFAAHESTYRLNISSPGEIAEIIHELNHQRTPVPDQHYHPKVKIGLDLSGDRLGVKVLFDGEEQTPTIFEGFTRSSARALDNVVLQALDDEGSWDEDQECWFVNSSRGIGLILGLIQEYKEVISLTTLDPITISSKLLRASISIEWLKTSVELVMHWVLPNGTERIKENELLGTGPYWAVIDNTVYRLAPEAAKIAGIFPYSATITFSKSQAGPIVEIINDKKDLPTTLKIVNPDLQPSAEIALPTPLLELERRETDMDHFDRNNQFEIKAQLDFQYPSSPTDQNLVYLPDREFEKTCKALLTELGFEYNPNNRCYNLTGDSALDLVHKGIQAFPSEWQITGLDQIRQSIRFAELNLNVSIRQGQTSELDYEHKPTGSWFDCHITLVQNNSNIPLSMLFKGGARSTNKWIRLDSGAYAQVPAGGLRQLRTVLGMITPSYKLSNSIKTRLNAAQAVSFSRVDNKYFQVDTDRQLKALARRLREFDSISNIRASRNFEGELRPYQTEGLSWINFLHTFMLDGILADEMGLGKTVQTLAFLQYLKDSRAKNKTLDKPALVVAPTSVISNWMRESQRFTPKLKVLLLHGPHRHEHFGSLSDFDLIITSYALLRLDRSELEQNQFSYVILDEAQNIKNHEAATTKAAKALQANRRLALTGTPTENRPLELWSIFDFLMPNYLGTAEYFRKNIERPILDSKSQEDTARFLRGKTRPFILRRLKSEVEKELPPKIESVLYTPMTTSQAQLYMQILEEIRPKIMGTIAEKGIGGASISILAALLRLRQVCNHPNSIDSLTKVPGFDSGKFTLMKELVIEAVESERKILLFSQFKEMLAIIRRWLEARHIPFLYLDGSTRDRQSLIDAFNNEGNAYPLFLISLKAGGTGLNLSAADTVIIYDPWWNPAVETQAVDRAHRIGQTKPVSVYRLVTENSVEQKIMDLKQRKAQIVDALINENGLSSLKLTQDDIDSLFAPLPED
jgi:superfamily II DNA or RNA helicase